MSFVFLVTEFGIIVDLLINIPQVVRNTLYEIFDIC